MPLPSPPRREVQQPRIQASTPGIMTKTRTAIDDSLFQDLKLMAQYASAAYCPDVYTAANTPIKCGSGNCPLVESANASTTLEYSRSRSPPTPDPQPNPSLTNIPQNRHPHRRNRLPRHRLHQRPDSPLLPRLHQPRQLAYQPRLRPYRHPSVLHLPRPHRLLGILERRFRRHPPRSQSSSKAVSYLPHRRHRPQSGRRRRRARCRLSTRPGLRCGSVLVRRAACWRGCAQWVYLGPGGGELQGYALERSCAEGAAGGDGVCAYNPRVLYWGGEWGGCKEGGFQGV